jgi:hypothetical protein
MTEQMDFDYISLKKESGGGSNGSGYNGRHLEGLPSPSA